MASTRTSSRTQSRSKGIITDKSSSLEETHNQFNHKASWDSDPIRVFLQLIANEITKGNRPFLVLSHAGYKSLAPEEWWNKIESINKMCAKFRKKNLEHRELMETAFMGASATGKHHWTPGEKLVEAADDSSDSVHSFGAQPFVDSIPAGVQDVDLDSSLEHVPIEKGKRRKAPSSSVSKSKKATSGASVITESMNNLTDVVRTKNQQVTVRHLTGNESLYTISECMHRLTSIPSLVGTPLFHFASTLMDNADLRGVMMCQPDDDSIVGWHTQKQLQCTVSAPFTNLFGAHQM
ncbi:uncharacterized protein LOC114302188 [Camellia sinensis]|uniref:uncharacterized protein LOC114302188 n=1 Tax=Camellia sinensis TaxID=4442 RepID=UPI001035A4B5|nr:uncharacterized protein LOC114302188 [Camellia sinensis]